MMNISLEQLRYFKTVIDERSYTRASAKLLIGQPTLSKAISKIEEEYGGTLIHRTTRSIMLTAEGRDFYEKALKLLSDFEGLSVKNKNRNLQRIRMGLPDNLALHALPKFQDKLTDSSIQYDYVIGNAIENQMRIVRGEIHSALFYNSVSLKELNYDEIGKIEFVIVTSSNSSAKSLSHLKKLSFAGSFQSDYSRPYIGLELLKRTGLNPINIGVSTNLQQLQIELSKLKSFYTVVPKFAVENEIRLNTLKQIHTPKKLLVPLLYAYEGSLPNDTTNNFWLEQLKKVLDL